MSRAGSHRGGSGVSYPLVGPTGTGAHFGYADAAANDGMFFSVGGGFNGDAFALREAGVARWLTDNTELTAFVHVRPSADDAKDLGLAGRAWRDLFHSGATYEPPTLFTTSSTLTARDRFSAWDGSSLTATLPTTPSDGCVLSIFNDAATALTVAAGGTGTIKGTASLAQDIGATYRYESAADVWRAF